MAGEGVGESELAPHLAETGIDVEEDALRRCAQQLRIVEVAHDVQEQLGPAKPPDQLAPRASGQRLAPLVEEGEGLAEPERLHHAGEIARARVSRAHLRCQPVEEEDVEAEPPEAEQVLEEDPGVAAVARPLGNRAGDDDRAAHVVLPARA